MVQVKEELVSEPQGLSFGPTPLLPARGVAYAQKRSLRKGQGRPRKALPGRDRKEKRPELELEPRSSTAPGVPNPDRRTPASGRLPAGRASCPLLFPRGPTSPKPRTQALPNQGTWGSGSPVAEAPPEPTPGKVARGPGGLGWTLAPRAVPRETGAVAWPQPEGARGSEESDLRTASWGGLHPTLKRARGQAQVPRPLRAFSAPRWEKGSVLSMESKT